MSKPLPHQQPKLYLRWKVEGRGKREDFLNPKDKKALTDRHKMDIVVDDLKLKRELAQDLW